MSSDELIVRTATARYPVVISPGALNELPARLRELGVAGALWLVSDTEVYPRYGQSLAALLRGLGYTLHTHTVQAGEASKSHAALWQLYDWLIGNGVERRDCVLALGGGVVGDLAGFAAASVLRGIGLIQIPTTLQAMVDAAIGGKTGINHPLGKNLIGAFHQPVLVLGDTDTLGSLPERELRAGWAEVVKHGVIRDATLFRDLELFVAQGQSPNARVELIRRAAAVKVAVVSNDEREGGERVMLNYGHTLGHALEAAAGYGTLLHGEAVAIGMHAAARIAQRLGLFAAEAVARQRQLLEAFGLAVQFPLNVDLEELLTLAGRDKKVDAQRIRWVLPTAIGSVVVRNDVPLALVASVVAEKF